MTQFDDNGNIIPQDTSNLTQFDDNGNPISNSPIATNIPQASNLTQFDDNGNPVGKNLDVPNVAPQGVNTTAGTDNATQTLQEYLVPKIPYSGPYNPDAPLKPSVWSDQVSDNSFPEKQAHVANTLLDTTPEKLAYLQKQYPNQSFGIDATGNIVYSNDKGVSWNQFEGLTSSPLNWAIGHSNTVPQALATAGGGTLGAAGGPMGAVGGAVAGAEAEQLAKRELAHALGLTPDVWNTQAAINTGLGAAVSQFGANALNNIIGNAALEYATTPTLIEGQLPTIGRSLSNVGNAVKAGMNGKTTLGDFMGITKAENPGFSPLVSTAGIEKLGQGITKAVKVPVGLGAMGIAMAKGMNPFEALGVGELAREGTGMAGNALNKGLVMPVLNSFVKNPGSYISQANMDALGSMQQSQGLGGTMEAIENLPSVYKNSALGLAIKNSLVNQK